MTDFKTFLAQATEPPFWSATPNFCFHTNNFPAFFFTLLFDKLSHRQILPAPCKKIDLQSTTFSTIVGLLSQTMLGMRNLFWLGNIEKELPEKRSKELLSLLATYNGPNIIVYAVETAPKVSGKTTIISVEDTIAIAHFQALAALLDCRLDSQRFALAQDIFKTNGTLALDTACMLIQYLELINMRTTGDAHRYLTSLIGQPPTLRALSEAFFAKNARTFFSIWCTLEHEFSEVFWLVYWSEQVWKAHYVVQFLKKKNFVSAKKMSFRLPYSFIDRDWQKSSCKELTKVHHELYLLDYHFKQGTGSCSFDLFFSNYFAGKFS